ncbi:hypothetical protein ACS0TY_021584 [Phlomoides rotata]
MPGQIRSLHDLVDANDDDCKDALRMDRAAFSGLCDLLQTIGGLRNSKYVSVQEKVAMFFSILAHHTKNRSVKYQFKRSGHTVSKYFHSVLQCVCKLHSLFLVEPEPILDDNTDPRWQDFKIVNNGWKSDNGFRAGFQRELEKGMRALIPGTDLLATPHINSKIHQWKKDYGSLFDVLSKSGVGWNCTTHTLDVIDEGVWEAQKKADPHVKGMRFKSWPYYEQWQDIFGRDRATGEHAVAAIDIVNDMLRYSETRESASVDKVCTADHIPEPVEENAPISKLLTLL